MELTMDNGFTNLSMDEKEQVQGGGILVLLAGG